MAPRTQSDRLTLNGIRLRPRIGVTADERSTPQFCEADVTVWGDFEAAASTDDLGKAFDYARMLELILESAHAREYNLVETLAYRIARDVLQSFPARKVQARVRKRPADLAGHLDFIEIEVEQD